MLPFVLMLFVFILGASIGSFLNVVVWRMPRNLSLVRPPSHCPRCEHLLAWYDNIPILGWLLLRGQCRYCRQPISPRYPLVEAATGLLFLLYYLAIYQWQWGPGYVRDVFFLIDYPIYFLIVGLLSMLLAASLIDAELFVIPLGLCWLMTLMGVAYHTFLNTPSMAGALEISPLAAALAAGGTAGWAISLLLWWRGVLPMSFPQGEPLLEVDQEEYARQAAEAKAAGQTIEPLPPDYSRADIRNEMRKEMAFLLPPLAMGLAAGLLAWRWPVAGNWATAAAQSHWMSGLLASLLGAMSGAFIVWLTRILGTLGFGRVAMGLGDVHLLLGVGAVIGAGPVVVAFFLAPFFGIVLALYLMISGKKRELPYGPYLAMSTAFVVLFYPPIRDYLRPGLEGLSIVLRSLMGWSN